MEYEQFDLRENLIKMNCNLFNLNSLFKILLFNLNYGLDNELDILDINSLCIIMHKELKNICKDMNILHEKLKI